MGAGDNKTPEGSLNPYDPIGVLALLVEACERGEPNLHLYLDAGHEAVALASQEPIYQALAHKPIIGNAEDTRSPRPAELYKQTGGGKPYIDAMVEHGYVIRKDGK